MKPQALVLKDAIKQFRHDQDKIIKPEETLRRFEDKLNHTGLKILKEVVRIDRGRLDIPVYFSVCDEDAYAAIGNYKQMGKGATPAQSQASAVMELGERFSLFSFLGNPANFVTATADGLEAQHSGPLIDFKWIARSVNDESDDLAIAEKLFRQLPLQWTWAHNLTAGEPVMVPFNWFYTINEFNGSCAGNCNEEAICQGICEIVERHVCALISRDRLKTPLIDMDTIDDPVACELIGKFRSAGIELYLSDFTAGMGIPSIGALAWDPSTFPKQSEIVWTAGTTPSASKALCRALTEVAQLAGDFNSSANYVASGLPKFHDLNEARYVTHPGKTTAIGSLPELGDMNIRKEVENCLGALKDRGHDVFMVDVRHPALQIPAFYTIIPGTQFRERAAYSSVAMICGKIIADTFAPHQAMAGLKQFDTALPGKYFLKFYLGRLFLAQGDVDHACAQFRQAIDLEPPVEDLASIYTYLGMGYKETQRYKEALDALEKADQADPERTDTLNLMGFCHFKLKAYEKAIACFSKIVALNPSSAIDYANLAVNYRALGDTAKAIEYYQLALELDSSIDFAREHLLQLGVEG